jgi:hypothetical protein
VEDDGTLWCSMESTKQRKKINRQLNYQANLYLLVNFISFFMFTTQNCAQDFDEIISESEEPKIDRSTQKKQ